MEKIRKKIKRNELNPKERAVFRDFLILLGIEKTKEIGFWVDAGTGHRRNFAEQAPVDSRQYRVGIIKYDQNKQFGPENRSSIQ